MSRRHGIYYSARAVRGGFEPSVAVLWRGELIAVRNGDPVADEGAALAGAASMAELERVLQDRSLEVKPAA